MYSKKGNMREYIFLRRNTKVKLSNFFSPEVIRNFKFHYLEEYFNENP